MAKAIKSNKQSKRELTRSKVIQAAIECIYQDGFNAAHTNRIAEAAGVSWGVLQYHFGDKDGLLQAVMDYVFEDFSQTLAGAQLDGEDLRARVAQLVDVVWELVSKKEYRVSVAILRNAGKDASSRIDGERQLSLWAKTTAELWDTLLADDICEATQSATARHLLFAALRGLADDINPRSSSLKQSTTREREALGDAITYLLTKQEPA